MLGSACAGSEQEAEHLPNYKPGKLNTVSNKPSRHGSYTVESQGKGFLPIQNPRVDKKSKQSLKKIS